MVNQSEALVEAIIIGAGHAGLAMSRSLKNRNVTHLVLERDQIGSSWRRRWDSFRMNTASQFNRLPGEENGEDGQFWTRDGWIQRLEDFQARFELPVRTGVEVESVRQSASGYEVHTSGGLFHSKFLVLCTGAHSDPHTPEIAAGLADDIVQLHTDDYRNPSDLKPGGVLVVGSGQSGAQIAEELAEAGRETWLSTSFVARVPRRYRGRDLHEWATTLGLAWQSTEDVPEPERNATQPLLSGTKGGHSMSLHALARDGVRLVGRVRGAQGTVLEFDDNLIANVQLGDTVAGKFRGFVDGYIEKSGCDAPAPEEDPADAPAPGIEQMARQTRLDLEEHGIGTVIWATGFVGNFSYLAADLLNQAGTPRHQGGVCPSPGLYCLGLNWLRTRWSGLIAGALKDCEPLADEIAKLSGENR